MNDIKIMQFSDKPKKKSERSIRLHKMNDDTIRLNSLVDTNLQDNLTIKISDEKRSDVYLNPI